MNVDELEVLAKRVLDAAYAVHRELGPGMLERTYEVCLKFELERRGLRVKEQVPMPVLYGGAKMVEIGYRVDLLVEGVLVVEVKSTEGIAPLHLAQLLTYLKLAKLRLGLLLNFNEPLLKQGIRRQINGWVKGRDQEVPDYSWSDGEGEDGNR